MKKNIYFEFFSLHLQEHKTGHAIEMVKPLILMFWSFVQVFMFCDFGENVTGGFEELNDAISENDWYTFPIGIQRMFPIIMISIQKTVILRGFGNIPCTREAFKKVSFFSRSNGI